MAARARGRRRLSTADHPAAAAVVERVATNPDRVLASGPESRLARSELRRLLGQALLELPERERHVLALYYEEELTMAEIGKVIGVCESRVSQLRSLALSRLRASMRTYLARPERPA